MKRKYWTLRYCLKRNNHYGNYYDKTFMTYDACIVYINKVKRVYECDLQGMLIDIQCIERYE